MSNNPSSNDARERISALAKIKNEDKMEEFKEKHQKLKASKRALDTGDGEEEEEKWEMEPPAKKMTAAERMMAQMGYKAGEGLGKNAQGIAEPVALSTQRGRTGLGSAAGKAVARDFTETWDEATEQKTIEEHVKWLSDMGDEQRNEICANLTDNKWIVVAPKKLKIDDETEFCDAKILAEMLEAKNVFDAMSDKDLREARTRANPYETIGSAFFQNRAAMKTANMDKIYDWLFSRENTENNRFLKKNPLDIQQSGENVDRNEELFYFADVCAGPGGFSEYMLWRKAFYNAKGFGFTLAGKDDFKLNKFRDSSAVFFETFYGTKQNGDVMDPENIDSLEDFVMRGTDNTGVHLMMADGGPSEEFRLVPCSRSLNYGFDDLDGELGDLERQLLGVHLMMADGGFSVEGQENLQEILSKRLYLCQLLVSLCIVREGGHFFCKLFDIFTPFSAALIHLMRVCYSSVSLHKPHTSRPANSERYITCRGLKKLYSEQVKQYLKRVNLKMEQLKEQKSSQDVQEIVPLQVMKTDEIFIQELIEHNHFLAIRQTLYLRKYQSFAKNQGQYDKDQGALREECLKYWAVPNKQRERGGDRGNRNGNMERLNPLQIFGKYSPKMCSISELSTPPTEFRINVLQEQKIPSSITYDEYRFLPIGSSQNAQILIGTGDATFILKNGHFEQTQKSFLRIPKDTIILVDMAEEFDVSAQGKISKKNNTAVVRILDAAVLYGDDVSGLPYEQRMTAAQKFATALKLTNRQVKEGWGKFEKYITPHLVVASKSYHLSEIGNFRSELIEGRFEHEKAVLFKEGEFKFRCLGLRFIRVIKQEWHLGWSKSQQLAYAHSALHKELGSIFEQQWASTGVYATFWDTAVLLSKERNRLNEQLNAPNGHAVPVPVMSWSWKACLRTKYGPDTILNHPDEFEDGRPTVAALKTHIEKNDEVANRQRH